MTDNAFEFTLTPALVGEEDPAAAAQARTQGWIVKRAIDFFGMGLLIAALWGELVVVVVNVVLRKYFSGNLVWESEASQLALSCLAFVGGAVAYGRGNDLAMTLVLHYLPERWSKRLELVAIQIVTMASIAMFVVSIPVLQQEWPVHTIVLHFPQTWIVVPYAIGMAMFAFYGCCRLYDRVHSREALLQIVALVLVAFGLTEACQNVIPLVSSSELNAVLAAVAILLLLAGVPIGFALMGCAAFVISAANLTTPDIVPRVMTSTTDNFVFIAIPFFVFAGLLLTNTGVSESIARLIANLLGRRSGGFLYVIVICMYIMSGLSGSKTADTVAVGTPLGDMLERYGFSREEGAGVLTAATVMGETVPPSLPILILGSVTTLSIGALFSAGLLPAAVLAVCLLGLIWFRSRGDSAEAMPRFSFRSLGRNAFLAIPGLCLPGILVGGIVGGIATPTEVSSFAVLYGVLLIFLYRTGVKMFWHTMQTALVMSGMLLFILPAAAAFSWLLTYAEIPQDVARAAIRVHGQPWIFVLVSILLFIFFGAALEGAAAIIVLAPIMVPAAAAVGINPLQYGIVLIIAMGIGTHLPLVGVGYYVACTAMKVPIHRVIGRTFAYLAIVLVGLVLIAFYSPFTLIVPRWMGLQ